MGFLTKEGLQNLTNKLVQGDAIKVASHRGKNVKEVIDNIQRECENVALPNTMTLENRVNEFKVGKGRDVDVSGDVEEGKVEIELEGRTYQNLLKENTLFTKAGGSDIEKIVHSVEQAEFRTISTGSMVFLKEAILKDNTIYTIIAQIKSSVKEAFGFSFKNNANYTQGHVYWHLPVLNEYCYKRMVLQTTTNCTHLVLGNHNNNLAKGTVLGVKNVILLEGDHSQTPIEEIVKYFDGIKSSFKDGVVDVEVQGKNIIDAYSNLSIGVIMDNNNISHNTAWVYTEDLFIIKPNTTYNISEKLQNYKQYRFIFFDSNKNFIGLHYINGGTNTKFITPCDAYYFRLNYSVNVNGNSISRPELQIEEGSNPTPYTPYYKKKISFNIGEPLRSLPNGVCDEIRNNNGVWELVRRIGEIVLNGSETYTSSSPSENTMFFILGNILCQKNGYCISNNFYYEIGSKDNEHIRINANGNIVFWLNISKLPSQDVEGLKQWLSQNPTKVVYELSEQIITPIEPMEFGVKPLATMTINSDIAPVSNHKVILNRAGQIEQGIELIANLKSRVNNLESIYDSNLIATQYRIDNLKLNYELEREED